jgi:hypothetical protein
MRNEYIPLGKIETVVRDTIDNLVPTLDRSPEETDDLKRDLEFELDSALDHQKGKGGYTTAFRVARQFYAVAKMYRLDGQHELSNELYWVAIQLHILSGHVGQTDEYEWHPPDP